MKVLFLAIAFPNAKKTTNLYNDLVEEFNNNGHEVYVIAPTLDNKTKLVVEEEINILRVKTYKLFNVGIIRKGIANVMLPVQFKKAIKSHLNKYNFDLILIPTPPISLYGLAKWLKKKSLAKTYLILRDIFPQNAVDLELIRENGLIHKYFRDKEKKLYKLSDAIGCMSKGNIDYLEKQNPEIDKSKLHLLPNWEKSRHFKFINNEENSVISKYNLENKFVILFGGNIGKPQQLENIIKLAIECKEIKDLVFFIIGGGSEKLKLEQRVKELQCDNIIIKDYVLKADYFKILSMADVGLISLNKNFTIPNIPSKCLSYFNLKKPILASLDKATDFGLILDNHNAGLWDYCDNIEGLKEKIILLYNNPELRNKMGLNGYNYLINELTPKQAYKTIINSFE